MILLDTDVVSALMRLHQNPPLQVWLAKQDPMRLVASTPSVFEIRYGIERLPQGRRRLVLETSYQHVIMQMLGNRILLLDTASAQAAGRIRAVQIGRGNNVAVPDSQIAGVALVHGAIVATRNTKDFSGLGLALVDPWQ